MLWIELAKLYRSMNDYDSIKGIFLKKKSLTSEFTQNGFNFESNNDYYQAKKCYDEALSQDIEVSDLERDLWEESLLRCCNELTEWKDMYNYTTHEKDLHLLFTNDSYSLEYLFPFAFRSKLKIILQSDIDEQEKHQDLIDFIKNLDSEGKKYLEQTYCLEMALINLHQKDLNAAKYFAHIAIQKYLMVK